MKVPLAEFIKLSVAELKRAKREALPSAPPDALLKLRSVELKIAIETEKSVNGKFTIFAVELGAAGAQTSTSEITLSFDVIDDNFMAPVVGMVDAPPSRPPPPRSKPAKRMKLK